MDFQLTDEQRALKAGMRELLAARFDREALRAAVDRPSLDRSLWRALGDAGFFALRLPEREGGVGLGLPEAVLVFEEAGRALLPGPLVATHLAAGTVEGAATGEAVVTRVDGALVAWLDEADHVQGDAGEATPIRSLDPLTPLHRTHGTRTATVVEAVLLSAAEQLGSAGHSTDLAVQHARGREQFGQPVGAFQAVKHLCADMLVRTEVARAAVYAAAVTEDPYEIAGAKLLADEAAVRGRGTVSRCTAGWGSPGRPMCICTSSGPGCGRGSGSRRSRRPRRSPRRCRPGRADGPCTVNGHDALTVGGPAGSPRAGVGGALRYSPWDASGGVARLSRCCQCGGSGPGTARRPHRPEASYAPPFGFPQSEPHSMHYAYSFALEYARSACCGDCTSTMLSPMGITFRDPDGGPCEARGDVSAGSDGVNGAGASGAVGGRAGSRRGGPGPEVGALAVGGMRHRAR